MCNNHLHTNQRAYDPTRTITLRNSFVSAMNRRFNTLARLVRQAVDTEDVFGLRTPEELTIFQTPGPKAFQFGTSAEKVEQFMTWFRSQVDKEILETTTLQQLGTATHEQWTNLYIRDSYKRGVIRARGELIKAGFENIPAIAESGGVDFVMNSPFHIDRVGLMYSRAYSELRGITAAMDSQISRILAQGIADGDGPTLLARKLVATINGSGSGELGITDTIGRHIPARRRAQILARTEVIRTHHQATIQEYKNWRVVGIRVQAEIRTAGDDRVCSICQPQEGEIYSIEEAFNLIPFHPQCRCIALPFKGNLI